MPLKPGQDGGGDKCGGNSDVCIGEEEPNLGPEDFLVGGIPVVGRRLGR